MLSRSGARRPALVLLGGGTLALALGDSGYTYLTALGRYQTGDSIDLGWIGGFALIALASLALARPRHPVADDAQAALSAASAEAAETVPGAGARGFAALPYAVVVLVGVALAGLYLAGHRPDAGETRLVGGVLLLVIVRQSLLVWDNHTLVRKLAAREVALAHRAYHDDLTGLPNRALLHERVSALLVGGPSGLAGAALLFCDLDDFKLVNDTLGHWAGDELLVRVSERMRRALRPGDTLARLGGDEFAVLEEGANPVELAGRLLRSLSEPFELGGRYASVRASIGVRVLPPGERGTPSEVLADADAAMYAAKRDGKGGVRVYDPSLRNRDPDTLELQRYLGAALLNRELDAAFQPIVDPRTREVVAAEVLARWDRPGGSVPPGVFVPLAERMGLISLLTDAMLDRGLGQLAEWTTTLGFAGMRLSVNVSALELRPDGRLPQRVIAVLQQHRIAPERLTVEVTESAVAPDEAAAHEVLEHLRAMGCRVALDDFGVGQSSLGRLHRFPVDQLKLDPSIVHQADTDPAQAVILRSVTYLGEQLGMQVVAEGVETGSLLARIRSIPGRPLVQGYAVGRPMPATVMTEYLMHSRPPLESHFGTPVRVPGRAGMSAG
jgi:diguanylate cyclase (GGDEF)-like protein